MIDAQQDAEREHEQQPAAAEPEVAELLLATTPGQPRCPRRRDGAIQRSGHRQEGVAEPRALELEREHRDPGLGERPQHAVVRRGAGARPSVERDHGRPSAGVAVATPAPCDDGAARRRARVLGRDPEAAAARRRRPARDLGDGPVRHDPAAVEDQDPRAGLLDLGEEVRAQHHGRAALAGDARARCRAPGAGPAGSSPSVGSSRNTTAGSLTRARAIPSRWRIPRL